MKKIINYLTDFYGFEKLKTSIPKNEFEYLKRNFYLFILNKISDKLFYFLREVSPIKYLENHPHGSLYFNKRVDNQIYELIIDIKQFIPEPLIRLSFYGSRNYMEKKVIKKVTKKDIDTLLSKDKHFKSLLRENKLKSILN